MRKLNTLQSQQSIIFSPRDTFNALKTLVFQLPIEFRLKLYKEIQKKDYEAYFDQTFNKLKLKAKKSGYSVKDVPRLIQEVRQEIAHEQKR